MKKQTRRTFMQTSAAALALATAGLGQKQTSTENLSGKSNQPKKDDSLQPKKDGSLEIAVLLFDSMTALDAVGPYEVLHRLPTATVKFVGETKGLKLTDSKMLFLNADYTLEEVPCPDVLLIPGGDVRVPMGSKKVIDWILTAHKTTKYTVSVCTGTLILGAAELLRGKKATTWWGMKEMLADFGAEYVAERYVQTGKIITAAGISAGIDGALFLAEKLADKQTAQMIQLYIEYDPQPPFNAGSLQKADKETIEAARRYLMRAR